MNSFYNIVHYLGLSSSYTNSRNYEQSNIGVETSCWLEVWKSVLFLSYKIDSCECHKKLSRYIAFYNVNVT